MTRADTAFAGRLGLIAGLGAAFARATLERSCVGRNAEEKGDINLTMSGEWRARSPYMEIMLNELVAASKFHLGVHGVGNPAEMLPIPSARQQKPPRLRRARSSLRVPAWPLEQSDMIMLPGVMWRV